MVSTPSADPRIVDPLDTHHAPVLYLKVALDVVGHFGRDALDGINLPYA